MRSTAPKFSQLKPIADQYKNDAFYQTQKNREKLWQDNKPRALKHQRQKLKEQKLV